MSTAARSHTSQLLLRKRLHLECQILDVRFRLRDAQKRNVVQEILKLNTKLKDLQKQLDDIRS